MKKYGLGMPGWMAVLVLVLSGAVAQAQDLTLNISDTGFDPVPAGGTIEYSVRLQNGGNTRSAADMLHFAIPAGAAYQGVAGDLEGCSPAPVLQGPASVSCPVPELAPRAELAGSVHLVPAGAGVTTFGGTIGTTTITEDTTVTTGADLGLGFDAPADIRAGDFLTFAAVIANDGPYPSEGTRLTVPLPPALSSDVTLPSGCTISGNEITCDIAGPIAVGDDVRLEFTTQILTADASSVSVAGSLSSSQPADPDLSNDENAFVIAISPGTDVRLGKARTPSGLLYVGQPVTFTLSPDFVGDAPLDAQITDDLPANYEFTSISPSGAGWACHDTNPVECSYSATTPDPAGFRAPITITAVPINESPAGAPVVNIAVIASSLDLVADNNTASDGGADIVLPTTDLVAEKSGPTHGLVTVGNEYDWRIGARNDGNIGFTGRLVLTDRLPEGLRATAIGAPAGWACTPGVPLSGPAEIICETDNYTATPLPVGGQTPRITITTEVLAEGRLDNILQVGFTDETYPDRDMSNNSITRGVTSGDGTTVGIADLALVKTVADPGPHVAGEPVRFTVEVSNSGPGTAEDVRVLDRLSDLYFTDSTTTGVTLDTVPADVGCTVTRGSGFYSDLACTIDELPAGETRSISFTALAGGNAGMRTNTAETYSTATPDPDYANNTGSVTYSVTPRTDVTVAKTASHAAGSDVQAGQRLRYILSASVPANGLSSAENVTVTDQLPAGLKFVSATPSQGVCDDPGATLVDGYLTSSLTEIRCNLGTITNGNTQSVEIVVAPTTQLVSQQIENRVGVETSTPEIDGTNNEAAIIHRVTAPALDLITNKTDDPDPLEINTPTTYTVTVRNAGPSEAFNLVITDTLPDAGMRYDGIVDAGGMACSEQDGAAVGSIGGRLTCTLPNLEVGATATLRVQMTGVQRGHWVNHVEARSDEYGHEAITANNAVSEATSVFERSNLAVTKAPSRAVVDLGEEFDWIITVENRTAAGIGLAENVVLRDMLPAEMVISDTVQTSGGSCDAPPGGRSLVCVLPDMVAGESHVVTVPVRVTSVGANPQDVANSASVETDSFDDDPADDTATGTVQVLSTTVSGAIWRDFNENDLRDGPVFPGSFDDRGVGGLTVHLTGTDEWGHPVSRSTTTAAETGSYAFPLLPPGNYSVSFTPPGDGYVANAGSALPNPMTGTASGRTEIRNIDAATDTPVSGNDFTLVPEARIALAKAVAGPILQPDGSYTLRYLFRVDNVSMEPLDDFIVTDHLQTDFGEYVTGTPGPGQFAVVSLTPGTLVSGADDQLVIARTGRMTPGQLWISEMILRVNPELPRTGAQLVLRNNAEVVATGELSGKQPTDASNDGGTPQRGVSSPSQRQLAFNPAMALAKTATLDNGGGAARAGDIIRFGFTVTNTGDTPLVDLSLADPLPGLVWDANPVLARLDPDQSDSTSFAAHYVLTQEDVEAGGLDNTATATGRWAVDGVPDPVTTAQGSAAITALAEPGLEVVKTEVANTVQDPTRPGDTIRYEFTVSNTGNTLLHDVVLTDDLPGIAADPAGSFVIGTLSPAGEAGSLVTFHADYTVTQDDIDAGEVINTARAAGTHGPGGPPIEADAPAVTTPLFSDPLMRVTKLVDTTTVPATPRAGDSIGWTVTIENTGNTSLNIGTIAESLPDASITAPGSALLVPGESTTAAVSHTLTQADIDAGEVANQVTVSGRVPGSDTPFRDTPSGNDPDTPNEDPTVVTLDPAPGIALLKSLVTDVSGPLMPGDAITFGFAIRNTGNVTLHDLVLSDDLPDVVLDDAALSGLSLAPDDEVTVTGSYVLTPADIEAGGFDNSATITASDPGGTSVTDLSGTGFDNDGPTRVDLLREPDIALIKTISAAPAVPAAAGDRIDYGFEIRNTGNVELRDIALADLVDGVVITGSRSAPLPVGGSDSTSFTGSYTLTQEDIDAGIFANTAQVTGLGTGAGGDAQPVSDMSGTDADNDDATLFVINPSPSLSITKAADDGALGTPPRAGDEITYNFTLTSTGNVTLSDVTVSDPLPGLLFAEDTIATLAPGNSGVLTATYVLTQPDIEAGEVRNRASASGDYNDPASGDTVSASADSNEVEVTLQQAPGLAVVKTAQPQWSGAASPGASIVYEFTVTNTGNVQLQDVVLTDPLPGLAAGTWSLGALEPGDEQVVATTYELTQADIDAGEVVNQAEASGRFGTTPVSDRSGPDAESDEETVVPLEQAPDLLLEKMADASGLNDPAAVGEEIAYSFVVTNSGNVTLRDIAVTDPLPGLVPQTLPVGELAPGASATVGPAIYAITQADINAGVVENRASVIGTYGPPHDPRSHEAPSRSESGADEPTVTPVAGRPGIALIKELAPGIDAENLRLGDEIRWVFAVANTGNVPLGNVTITEEMVSAVVSGGPVALDVGQVDNTSFIASHIVTQADLDAGEIENRARAQGFFDAGPGDPATVEDMSGSAFDNDEPTVAPLGQRPAIDLVKTADTSGLSTPPQAGEVVRYGFTITNSGEVTLSGVTLDDAMPGLELAGAPIASLAPGASDATSYSATYALTQEDIDSGATLENRAEASGSYTGRDGNPQRVNALSATDGGVEGPTLVMVDRAPGLELVKTADRSGVSETALPGETVTYEFALTNTGNVTLHGLSIDDPLPGLVLLGAPIASLAPGETSHAITGTYALTPEDIRAAELDNTARAHAFWRPDGAPPVPVASNESSVIVPLGYPEIALDITIGELRDLNGDGIMGPGDLVFFRFEVTNTGTVPLNDVTIDGASLSLPLPGLLCTPITLAPGESAFLDCSGGGHAITLADAERGQISLAGDATGSSDAGVMVRSSSAAISFAEIAQGGVTIEKIAGVETAMIGDLVPYTITIRNSAGGVAITARVEDMLPAGFSYRAGSARLDGVPLDMVENGRRVGFGPITVEPGQSRALTMSARVGGSVRPGAHENRARLLSTLTGREIAPEARATVRVLADAVLQCATVLGRVFDDLDQNGHMSAAAPERGLPDVRLITPNGLAIMTDEHGRYSVPCAALPRAVGSNFMLKLDERTLPAGYRLTTENPRVVRLTPGMITRLDFGATLARLVRVDLAANAFDQGQIGAALDQGLHRLVAEIEGRAAMLRLTYVLEAGEPEAGAQARLRQVERRLRDLWRDAGRYKLNIETLVQRAGEVK